MRVYDRRESVYDSRQWRKEILKMVFWFLRVCATKQMYKQEKNRKKQERSPNETRDVIRE